MTWSLHGPLEKALGGNRIPFRRKPEVDRGTTRPELNKWCRRELKPTNRSWKLDETYIPVAGEWKYLYRAVDSTGPLHPTQMVVWSAGKPRSLRSSSTSRYEREYRNIPADPAKNDRWFE